MIRPEAEIVLLKRVGTIFTAVGLDGVTSYGNTDLNDPLWFAMQRLGYSVASISSVSNDDLSKVAAADLPALLDLAELRALETARNAATSLTDITVGPRHESLSQLASGLSKTIDAKQAEFTRVYGSLVGTGLEAGTFTISSQEDGSNVY